MTELVSTTGSTKWQLTLYTPVAGLAGFGDFLTLSKIYHRSLFRRYSAIDNYCNPSSCNVYLRCRGQTTVDNCIGGHVNVLSD